MQEVDVTFLKQSVRLVSKTLKCLVIGCIRKVDLESRVGTLLETRNE